MPVHRLLSLFSTVAESVILGRRTAVYGSAYIRFTAIRMNRCAQPWLNARTAPSATAGVSHDAHATEASTAQLAPYRSRSRSRSALLDTTAQLLCGRAAHRRRKGRRLTRCDQARVKASSGAPCTPQPRYQQRGYDSPTISASASTCSAYRPTGLTRRWLAPAATNASNRSRTCSGVP